MAVSNSLQYQAEWTAKVQERLDKPQNWKEICRVDYTNTQVLNNPYLSTEGSAATHTRGSEYTIQTVGVTNDSVTINQSKIVPRAIDRADLAQSNYVKLMDLADNMATILNEALESAMLATYGSLTDFGTADIGEGGASTDAITVSASNVDNIIRGVREKIRTANGQALADRFGVFICWRSADFTQLEAFMQANGFNLADQMLKNGGSPGVFYGGVWHYVSNSHTANHVVAGVRNLLHLGIVKDTYGQTIVVDEPATSSGSLSAVGISMRVDYAFKVWNNFSTLLYDVNVN